MKINVPTEAIDKLIDDCSDSVSDDDSKFPGMTYEQGILEVISWLKGEGDHPLED